MQETKGRPNPGEQLDRGRTVGKVENIGNQLIDGPCHHVAALTLTELNLKLKSRLYIKSTKKICKQ